GLLELSPEAAQSAVDVMDRRAEPEARERAEERIADPPMQHGHRAVLDAPAPRGEAAALHEIASLLELAHEPRHLAEVVAVVRVPHDHELAASPRDPGHQGAPVPAHLDGDQARPGAHGDLSRSIGAPIVGDDDLPADAALAQRALRLLDARGERVRLVEA